MSKKMNISRPISYTTHYPETQLLEHALSLAQDIKDKKIDAIRHNKAHIAFHYIQDQVNNIIHSYNQQITDLDNNEQNQSTKNKSISRLDNMKEVVQNLIESTMGKDTELGEWFNQDRNTQQPYQKLMDDINIPAPQPLKEHGISQILPRRVSKAYQAHHQYAPSNTQDFKKRASHLSNRTTDTDESSDDSSLDSFKYSQKK